MTFEQILLNEIDNSNNWFELSKDFQFTYEQIIKIKDKINWYTFIKR